MRESVRQAALMLALASAAGCVLSRAQVKSLSDPAAHSIQFENPTVTTIGALNGLPSRCGSAGNRRVRREELLTYQVTGRIVRVSRKRDRDVHVVLADSLQPSAQMIVEVVDPDFKGNAASPYHAKLVAARQAFDALAAGARGPGGLTGAIVRVTGVGFFDIAHFQRGRARSCIELHPVLDIQRVDGP